MWVHNKRIICACSCLRVADRKHAAALPVQLCVKRSATCAHAWIWSNLLPVLARPPTVTSSSKVYRGSHGHCDMSTRKDPFLGIAFASSRLLMKLGFCTLTGFPMAIGDAQLHQHWQVLLLAKWRIASMSPFNVERWSFALCERVIFERKRVCPLALPLRMLGNSKREIRTGVVKPCRFEFFWS